MTIGLILVITAVFCHLIRPGVRQRALRIDLVGLGAAILNFLLIVGEMIGFWCGVALVLWEVMR